MTTLVLGAVLTLVWLVMIARLATMMKGVVTLAADTSPEPTPYPRLSVIVAARNEAGGIVHCLEALLAQDYPDLEIVAVNDRSTDDTGRLMDEVHARAGVNHLTVVHLSECPPGWLGKCNALQHAAEAATGQWLLFCDGDVVLKPGALRRAVALAEAQGADLLPVLPEMLPGSALERAMMAVFGVCFMSRFSPKRAMDPKSPAYIGVGAFNMVRAETWRRIGGHQPLRLMVIDDVGLGREVKRAGGRIVVAEGTGQVSVRWYEDVISMIRGLEKNSFAALGYSIPKTLVGVGLMMAVFLLPYGLVAVAPWGWPMIVGALPCVLQWLVVLGARGRGGGFGGATSAALLPVGALLVAFTILRSMVVVLRQGGVRWRDSFYPLAELREHTL